MSAAYILHQSITDTDGDTDDVSRWECTDLHDAIRDLSATRTAHVDGVEYRIATYADHSATCIITVQNGMEFRTGEREERALAIVGITRTSARRLARLLECEWSAR